MGLTAVAEVDERKSLVYFGTLVYFEPGVDAEALEKRYDYTLPYVNLFLTTALC